MALYFLSHSLHVITAAVDAGKLDAVFLLLTLWNRRMLPPYKSGIRNDVVSWAEQLHQK